MAWNALKGSWNLSLQTLGWGRLLAGDDNPLHQGLWANDVLRRGRPDRSLTAPGSPRRVSFGKQLARVELHGDLSGLETDQEGRSEQMGGFA
jgi:hypothetical protein